MGQEANLRGEEDERTYFRVEHTPGPWRWNTGNEFLVSECCGMVHSDEHRASPENARLIAAAPDLLEACRSFVKGYNRADDRDCGSVTAEKIFDAIAKAEGRS